MPYFWNAEIAITLFLQSLASWLLLPMRAFSFLGQEEFFLLVMPALYWCVDVGIGFRSGAVLLLGTNLNCILKSAFHAPRPFWYSPQVKALSTETTFGFPSNHAETAAGVWGWLAARIRRAWAWWLAGVVILAVGVSRIYLGMHFTSDVIAGWLLGIATVILLLVVDRPLSAWLARRSFWQLAGLGLASGALLVAGQVAVNQAVSTLPFPLQWVVNAGNALPQALPNPLALSTTLDTAGLWFGLCVGAAWLKQRGGMDASGTAALRVERYLLGMAGVGVLYLGLSSIFPHTDDLLGNALRCLRYSLVGFWVSGGAPLLFLRLELAKSRPAVEIQPAPGELAAEINSEA